MVDHVELHSFEDRVITVVSLMNDLLSPDTRASTGVPGSSVEHLVGYALERALALGARQVSSDIVDWAVLRTADLASVKPVLRVLFEEGWLDVDDPVLHFGVRRPPVSMAARCGNEAAVAYFIARGADVNQRSSANLTPLHYATDNEEPGNRGAAVISLLAAAGADLEAEDTDGQTPLCRAAINENIEAFAALYQAGADLGKKDIHGVRIYEHVGRRSKLFPLLKAIRARKTLHVASRRRRAWP